MKLVLDTDVVVAGMRSPSGASAQILREARRQRVVLLASVSLAIEYEAVCQRTEHGLAAGLDAHEVTRFLDALVAMAEPVKTHYLWRPQLHDPADEMVLETAVNGYADALVTFNRRHFLKPARKFGITVILPGIVLERLKKGNLL